MAQPKRKVFQRKKGGRYVGQFYVRDAGGDVVALGTKDAREANRRAGLAFKGKWPPADAAAEVAAAAEFVPEESHNPVNPEGGGQSTVEPSRVPSEPVPAAVVNPPPPASGGDEPDPVAAAVAAAADVTGSAVAPADAAELDDIRAEMGRELMKLLNLSEGAGTEGGPDVGATFAAITMGLEYEMAEAVAARRGLHIPEPSPDSMFYKGLAAAGRVVARRLLSDTIEIHPAWIIAGVLIGYPIQMAMTAKPVAGATAEQPSAPLPS